MTCLPPSARMKVALMFEGIRYSEALGRAADQALPNSLDAHHIFDTLDPGSLEIEPLKMDVTFYCNICQGTATSRTCPHDEAQRLAISGTRLREMFANNESIPATFSRPEVLEVLRAHYDGLS